MDVILLERLSNLGQMGETVRVRDGYARNFLLPRGKALRATEGNKQRFEAQRADLVARNEKQRADAEKVGKKLDGESFVIIRQAGESGQLYGSVSTRDIAEAIGSNKKFKVTRDQVVLNTPIKSLGLYTLPVRLHADVDANVTVNVARSNEEAERQARGEQILARETDSISDLGLEVGAALAEAGGDR